MTQYRLFFINTASGHIDRAEVVDAIDDLQAVEVCQGRPESQASELWYRSRRVHSFAAGPVGAPAPSFA